MGPATGVHPHHAGTDRMAVGVDGNGAGPLPGAGHRHDPFGGDGPRPDATPGRLDDEAPPELGILADPAIGEMVGTDR